MGPSLADRLRRNAGQESAGQRAARWALLALALAIAAVVEFGPVELPIVREVEAHLRDAAMTLTATGRSDPRLAIVDIDEESLKRFGPWPWPRARLAELAERLLSDAGAALVVFDLVLTDPQGAGADEQVGDSRIVALARARGLVGSQAFDYARREEPIATGHFGGAIVAESAPPAAVATGFIGNFAELAQAPCIGNIGIVPDPDGRVRRLAPLTAWQGRRFPALALAALGCLKPEIDLAALSRRLPVNNKGWWAVPFAQRPESFFSVSASSVLSDELVTGYSEMTRAPAASALSGRIVVLGSSALGLADRVATPLSSNVAGVTVHAAAMIALLDLSEGKARAIPAAWLMPAWALVSIVILWWSIVGGRLRAMLGALALVLPLWAGLAGWMATSSSVAPVSAALWGYAAVLLLHLPIEWSWSQARVRSRNRLLARYVARPVLDELFASDGEDPLVPRRCEITVLIADMQDYTRLTNDSSLEDAARLTKGFLAQLTGPVLEHRGTLDRYTGDGLVAFWGAPIEDADHADRALDAALAILSNVERFNAQRVRDGLPSATVRMGVASGSALVGDLGTPFRIAYTAVGDCINLASRLQQASRDVGVNILVSSTAAAQCRRNHLRAIGTVPVRGLPDQAVFTPSVKTDRPETRSGA